MTLNNWDHQTYKFIEIFSCTGWPIYEVNSWENGKIPTSPRPKNLQFLIKYLHQFFLNKISYTIMIFIHTKFTLPEKIQNKS